jgi:SPP1 family predicted phage head-tail adaptor
MGKEFPVRAGRLRHRLEIQKPIEARDAMGGVTITWDNVVERWGSIEPVNAREINEGSKVEERITHRIRMRHHANIAPSWRIVNRGKIYNVIGIRDIDERRKVIEIQAVQDPQVAEALLLKEDGAKLLLESGGGIIIE